MSRGLLILAGFAGVLAALVYWGPLKLSLTWEQPNRATDRAVTDAKRSVRSVAPPSEHADSMGQLPAREPVLAATGTPASAPRVSMPERTPAGFPPVPQESLPDDQMAAAIKQAELLHKQGLLVEARDQLSDVFLAHVLTPEQRLRIAEVLEPLCWELLTSQTVIDGGQVYNVEPGDVLGKLARPFHVPPEFIMRINGLRSDRAIRPRQTLKLLEGPFDVLVEPNEFELTVLRKGKFVRRFPVGIGKTDSPTPNGLFQVNQKLVKPKKWPDPGSPDRRIIEGGAPDNPLGSRWIGIDLGYGIHGTIEPQTIGQRASRGCIRMRNEDVEQLYDMVIEGSHVLIR
jgi:lipoprotein-anchoring transpeptidase ErfK/SrfK